MPEPVATDDWPAWVRFVAARRLGLETGVGDTLERLLGSGGRAIKASLAEFGIDCGCCGRRDKLNTRYPYMMRKENGQ